MNKQFSKLKDYILSNYDDVTSFSYRRGEYYLNVVFLVLLFYIINRLIHIFEPPSFTDLLIDAAAMLTFSVCFYFIKRKNIDSAILVSIFCVSGLIISQIIYEDYSAEEMNFIHPFHLFQITASLLLTFTFFSYKLASTPWLIGNIVYGVLLHLLGAYALSIHYEDKRIVFFIAAVSIFQFTVGVVGLSLNSRFQLNQNKIIENQQKELLSKTKDLEAIVADLRNFSYVASHDLHAPLRSIISFQQIIQKKIVPLENQELNEYLKYATDSAIQMKETLNDLLQYSRLSNELTELELTPVDLNEVVKQVTIETTVGIDKEVIIDIKGILPQVLGTRSHCKLFLQNLIANGLKYNKSDIPTVILKAEETETTHIIHIKDNGIGIAPEFLEEIFEPFRRLHTQRQYEGTGFGLAITKRIVEKVGGSICVSSEVGRGSKFTVCLPK